VNVDKKTWVTKWMNVVDVNLHEENIQNQTQIKKTYLVYSSAKRRNFSQCSSTL
jgi:hypothetical protein